MDAVMYGVIPSAKSVKFWKLPPVNRLYRSKSPEFSFVKI